MGGLLRFIGDESFENVFIRVTIGVCLYILGDIWHYHFMSRMRILYCSIEREKSPNRFDC